MPLNILGFPLSSLATATLSLTCLTFIGCSSGEEGRPQTVPVKGVLKYKNLPVEGATVIFLAPGTPRSASGITNPQGEFILSTFNPDDGAIVGEHVVTVSKIDPELKQKPDEPADAYTTRMLGKDPSKSLLPQKYASPQKTPLRRSVKAEGANEILIELE